MLSGCCWDATAQTLRFSISPAEERKMKGAIKSVNSRLLGFLGYATGVLVDPFTLSSSERSWSKA
jgi:hypothetical protein